MAPVHTITFQAVLSDEHSHNRDRLTVEVLFVGGPECRAARVYDWEKFVTKLVALNVIDQSVVQRERERVIDGRVFRGTMNLSDNEYLNLDSDHF